MLVVAAFAARRRGRAVRQRRRGTAGVATPGLAAFLDGDGGDDQGGDRVGPGPAEQAVEEQPDQQHRRQVGAEQGLLGVGDGRQRAELAPGAALRLGQDRHDDQAGGGQDDPDGECRASPIPSNDRTASMMT